MRVPIVIAALLLSGICVALWWRERDLRRRGDLSHCVSNMRDIDVAKLTYAMDHDLANGAVITEEQISEFFEHKQDWQRDMCCLTEGSRYDIGRVGENPSCAVHGTLYDSHLPDGTTR